MRVLWKCSTRADGTIRHAQDMGNERRVCIVMCVCGHLCVDVGVNESAYKVGVQHLI